MFDFPVVSVLCCLIPIAIIFSSTSVPSCASFVVMENEIVVEHGSKRAYKLGTWNVKQKKIEWKTSNALFSNVYYLNTTCCTPSASY